MVEEAYLPIVFDTHNKEDNLRRIEILGVPSECLENGEYQVSDNSKSFLTDCITKSLFEENRTLSQYSFKTIKIWLCDTRKPQTPQGYLRPKDNQVAFELRSHLEASELKYISVLDIGLKGDQHRLWKNSCEELLKPMFSRFIAPPNPPDVLKDFLAMRFGTKLSSRMDLYLNMRKNMFFDALIIEAK